MHVQISSAYSTRGGWQTRSPSLRGQGTRVRQWVIEHMGDYVGPRVSNDAGAGGGLQAVIKAHSIDRLHFFFLSWFSTNALLLYSSMGTGRRSDCAYY